MRTVSLQYLRSCVAIGLLSLGALQFWGQAVPAPSAHNSLTGQGVALYMARRYAEAKDTLLKAVAANPRDAEARAYLGQVYSDDGHDPDAAAAALEEAVRLEPQRSLYHQWLGSAYGDQADKAGVFKGPGFAKKCRMEFEKAVALDPNDVEARDSLMQFYSQAPGIVGGGMDKARAQAAAITKLDPSRGFLAEASIAEREKDAEKAESFYRKALSAARDKGKAYGELGRFLLKTKRNDEAVALFRQHVKDAPSDPAAHDDLADALMAQGQADEALAEYRRALELDPYFSAPLLGMARACERLGQRKEAREAYRRFLELMPKGKDAEEARARLQDLKA